MLNYLYLLIRNNSYLNIRADEKRGNSLFVAGGITRGRCRRLKYKSLFRLIFLLSLSYIIITFSGLKAENANRDEMERVCVNWLTEYISTWGGWFGSLNPSILSSSEIRVGDTLLALCFHISPSGFVIIPVYKDLPPIKAYSENAALDEKQSQGFMRLLKNELKARIEILQLQSGKSSYRAQWERLSLSENEFEEYLADRDKQTNKQAGPLLTSSWHQSLPYKRRCPVGDGGICPVGCVALAMAQIMRFLEWPVNGVGSHSYFWDGDQSCGDNTPGMELTADFADLYVWDNMPDSCDYGCDSADSAALAELNYEIAAAIETDFGTCGSTSNATAAINAYTNHYMYSSEIMLEARSSYSLEDWFALIQTEINANRPIHYFIPGHSLICDGWRIQGEQYEYHMNYGWGGQFTTWYVLDSVIPSPSKGDLYRVNDNMLINIKPETESELELVCFALNDSLGDGNGHAEVGEIVEISFNVTNNGYQAFNVQATISCGDPFISILTREAFFDDSIYWGEIQTSQTSCCIHVRNPCPDPYIANIQVVVSALGGYSITDSFYLFIGSQSSFADDMENGQDFWTIPEPGADSVNEWHLENFRSHSGSMSWKAGGLGSANYANNSHSLLISPPFLLPLEAELSLWHWIDAELSFLDSSAMDGGMVMITSDCEEWIPLVPDGGYTHSASGIACYSGSFDWCKARFDLSQYSGVVRIIYYFFSNRIGTREGWYIDDMEIYSMIPCGDANRDDIINVSDVVFLINYVFIAGSSAPVPYCAGDCNANGNVDVTDAVIIINFIYSQGAPPQSGCCD